MRWARSFSAIGLTSGVPPCCTTVKKSAMMVLTDYRGMTVTTVGEEKDTNPYVPLDASAQAGSE